jgi:hypothetical protein
MHKWLHITEGQVCKVRKEYEITLFVKRIGTVAAEFPKKKRTLTNVLEETPYQHHPITHPTYHDHDPGVHPREPFYS